MTSNLKFKALFIVAVILVCLYGIIGIPKSKDEIVQNFQKNIRLGLDLRGGSQLVMQVQVQDAFKAEARCHHRTHEGRAPQSRYRLRLAGAQRPGFARAGRHQSRSTSRTSPPPRPATSAGVINDLYGVAWILTPLNSTDYKMTMKTSEALKLRKGHGGAEQEHHRKEDQRPRPDRVHRAGARERREGRPTAGADAGR